MNKLASAQMVWDFRESAAAWWPTPAERDALRFAFTEAGEAIDAELRAALTIVAAPAPAEAGQRLPPRYWNGRVINRPLPAMCRRTCGRR